MEAEHDWYVRNIEPEIREVVRLLRDNGVNTVSSCGHGMRVEASWEGGELYEVFLTLYKHRNGADFTMTGRVVVKDRIPYWSLEFKLEDFVSGQEDQAGELCGQCGLRYPTVYSVPDEVWEKISRGHALLCWPCAEGNARAEGITLFWKAGVGAWPGVGA